MIRNLTVPENNADERVDSWLTENLPGVTRSHVQKLIHAGNVCINGKCVRNNYRVKPDDLITVDEPAPAAPDIAAEDIPLDILYEDEDVILVNKPKGMVVHPAAGHNTGTLVNALLYHCRGNLSGINGILRPGIVHRIDKDTTGVIIACKNDAAHNCIAAQLKEHSITRRYRAIVCGRIREDSGTVDAAIGRDPSDRKKMKAGMAGGKQAVTHYRVLERFRDYTYIECVLETGRTHQIRVHMASVGHPVLGDGVYAKSAARSGLEGQTLHAMVLGFRHPRTGEYMEFSAPLPDYFAELLRTLPRA